VACPLEAAALTPMPHMTKEDGWHLDMDVDIKLLCLRLFSLQHLPRVLRLVGDLVPLARLLPFLQNSPVGSESAYLAQVVVRQAAHHVVRAEVSSEAVLPHDMPDLVARFPLPCALIVRQPTSFADSCLVLPLIGSAPHRLSAACMLSEDPRCGHARQQQLRGRAPIQDHRDGAPRYAGGVHPEQAPQRRSTRQLGVQDRKPQVPRLPSTVHLHPGL
jgi:hypothetical protein